MRRAHQQSVAATVMRTLLAFATITFLLFALLHLGLQIPLGFAVLAQPHIRDAAIVEGLSGLGFAVSAYAVFTRQTWAWPAALAAHAVALAGVLLGMAALSAGLGPRTELNDVFHRVMLLLLVAGLTLLLTLTGRAALGRTNRSS